MNKKKTNKSQGFLKEHKTKSKLGKKLCVILMVIFTLVMAADIVNLFVTPAQSQMGFGPGGGFEMPDGGAFQRPGDGEMPGGDFQMPEGGELPGGDFRMPEGGFGNGEAPEGMGEQPSFEGGPTGNRGGRQGGFLQTVRNAWLPILIVCSIGDMVCLIILLRIRRKEKAVKEAFDGVPGMPLLEEEEEDDDEPPKRKRGPWAAILCMVTAFAMILGMIPTEDTDSSSANVHQEVISGTAEAAQIHTVLSGAGTLEADTLTPVTVPQQVTVLSYHVRNGETVAAGDPLVSVDKTSASSAMMDLSNVLEDLDDDLETARQASNSRYIYSTVAGRVKKIYAREGDKVTDVLYEHGALMILSLDGTMKVTFRSGENLTVGDEVTVQYSGVSEKGRIATVREGSITVTLSDETAEYGAQATVFDTKGTSVGEGKIEVGSALKVISYYGTVDDITVDVGDKVSVGKTLMTLGDTGYTTDYQILLARRNELEKQMQKLSQLARTGMVLAENDGIVSGVPDDAEIELLSTRGQAKSNNLSASSGGWQLVMLSNVETTETTPPPETTAPPETTLPPETTAPPETTLPPETTVPPETTLPPETTEPPVPSVTTAYYAAYITAVNGTSVTVNYAAADGIAETTDPRTYIGQMTGSATFHISYPNLKAGDYLIIQVTLTDGVLSSDAVVKNHIPTTTDTTPVELNGNYAAYLIQLSGGKLFIGLNPTALTDTNVDLAALKGQMTQVEGFAFTVSAETDIPLTDKGKTSNVKLADLKANDLLVVTFDRGIITAIVRAQRPAAQPTGPSQGGEMPGGNPGGSVPSSGMPSSGGMTVQKSYDQYIAEETELLYISDQQEIAVTISVDELDILSLERGLEAQITLDAMKGQSFTGSIARISNEGTNDGGNTKFTVTVILPREAMMLDGMNASVKVVTATSDAAVSIPAAALVEEDGKTYVYTAYNEETDILSGLTEVETGASDGDLVEILSGLNVGDTFYYRYADTVTYSFLTRV